MNRDLATVIFGLAASLCWGTSDFGGGLASRRTNATSIAVATYAIGFLVLDVLALIWREPFPSLLDMTWGGLAGLASIVGMLSFYLAASIGRMGITSTLSAILTAALPVIFSIFMEGLPNLPQLAGFVLALLAIVLMSRPERLHGRPKGIGLALLSGCGFGCLFILISRVSHGATFWPLAMARFTSVLFLLIVMGIRRQPILPKMNVASTVLYAGVLGAIGNACFVLAVHTGRLDVATLLSSLSPAATVLLAAIFLRERVTHIQAIGILLALVAIPLISV